MLILFPFVDQLFLHLYFIFRFTPPGFVYYVYSIFSNLALSTSRFSKKTGSLIWTSEDYDWFWTVWRFEIFEISGFISSLVSPRGLCWTRNFEFLTWITWSCLLLFINPVNSSSVAWGLLIILVKFHDNGGSNGKSVYAVARCCKVGVYLRYLQTVVLWCWWFCGSETVIVMKEKTRI